MQFQNPILPGFYPDPSICRVDEDYYLVTSTFEYFPGVPIFHSKDLVHWNQIGHVLNRPSQLNLDDFPASSGIFAPTLRYHDGTFYMITTLVDERKIDDIKLTFRNFIVTAKKPAGPWSEPYFLEDAPGIDPSLFFDDDGKVYYIGKRRPPTGEKYWGNREIWLQELDLNSMTLKGDKYSLWEGAMTIAIHTEGPHLYKVGGYYYLLVAEGGTGHLHAVTAARSKTITGPYECCPLNPLLTHRHLGYDYPIVNTGHGDLVETQNGEWWMVLLASRPYGGYFCNLGRETFLVPVRWEQGWPHICPGIGKVEFEHTIPNLPVHPCQSLPACDHFIGDALDIRWNFLRTPREAFWSLKERPGYLRLKLRPQMITECVCPSFVGRRQQHINFSARTSMEFSPQNENECAGFVLLQNNRYHIRFVYTRKEKVNILSLVRREADSDQLISETPVTAQHLFLKIEAIGQEYSFYYATAYEDWIALATHVDGRNLSPQMTQGYTGAYIGLYASSNGKTGSNTADFDYFEYSELVLSTG